MYTDGCHCRMSIRRNVGPGSGHGGESLCCLAVFGDEKDVEFDHIIEDNLFGSLVDAWNCSLAANLRGHDNAAQLFNDTIEEQSTGW